MAALPPADHAPPAGRIEVRCLSCGRQGSLDAADRRIAGVPLVRLTRHLVCSACGSRALRAAAVTGPRELARRKRARLPAASAPEPPPTRSGPPLGRDRD